MLGIVYRKPFRLSRQGFTIVELLIVVVVIGILAAIIVVSYNGITGRALETSIKSDLQNAATILELDATNDGVYPGSASAANGGTGLKVSGDNILTYSGGGQSFCVSISNPKVATSYRLRAGGSIEEGSCAVTVETVAGPSAGTSGYVNGSGAEVRFSTPFGLAVDGSGTIYVADKNNLRIRKITPQGVVSTFAGSGSIIGFPADATGEAATFVFPEGMVMGPDGKLYVAESGKIRTVTIPGAVVQTIGGMSGSGYQEGALASAKFGTLSGIDFDSAGNMYVVDVGNQRIRKISTGGVVSLLAGSGSSGFANGTGAAAQFSYPSGIAVDSSGNVFVADTNNYRIRKITPAGVVTTFAGGTTGGIPDGQGEDARFISPKGLAIDENDVLYVADGGRIRKITPDAVVTTIAGDISLGYVDGEGLDTRFSSNYGITVHNGVLYVSEGGGHRIRKITL